MEAKGHRRAGPIVPLPRRGTDGSCLPARFLLTARHNRRPTLLPPRHTSTACWRTALRHSDVLTMTSWMGLTRSRTVDCLPKQRFPSQGVVLGRVGFADALNASGPCEVSE